MEEKVTCPSCKGSGEHVGTNPLFSFDMCMWCNGTGKVTQKDADYWKTLQEKRGG